MHITNQKWSFDIFTVQNIFMEHDFYLISNDFWHKRKMDNFDPHNIFLAIATIDWFCAPGTQMCVTHPFYSDKDLPSVFFLFFLSPQNQAVLSDITQPQAKVYNPHEREGRGQQSSLAFKETCNKTELILTG